MKEKINYTQMFKSSRLHKKSQQKKWLFFDVMHRFLKMTILWEWTDIALCFRIYQQAKFSDYLIGVEMQILWLNIYLQCFQKHVFFNLIAK